MAAARASVREASNVSAAPVMLSIKVRAADEAGGGAGRGGAGRSARPTGMHPGSVVWGGPAAPPSPSTERT